MTLATARISVGLSLAPDEDEPVDPFVVAEEPGAIPSPFPMGVRLSPRPRRVRPLPLLPSEPALFPWLARRFSPGEATIWSGPRAAVEPILELLYAGSARAGGRISLVEGANRFHPYRVGELGRAFGVDATATLARIRLARAFTVYQLVALVDRWAVEARRHPPSLLLGHDLPALFANDAEVPAEERTALLRHLAGTLTELVREVRVPLLLTLGPGGVASFPGLAEAGPRWCDLVTFARGPGTLRLRALRDNARATLVARPAGQRGIEEFGGGSVGEVIAWDAPLRPTARRSRNG